MIGRLLSGVHQLAVRWYTVSEATSSAIDRDDLHAARPGADDRDPLAGEVDRLSSASRPVWCASPRKSSRPGTSGKYGTESTPVAATRNRARAVVPVAALSTIQVADSSSQTAEVTRAPNRMWRRRSNRSTTWLR